MEGIKSGIEKIINTPYEDKQNFDLGYSYENEGQYASAVSFYLRCAEFSSKNLLISESLIRASLCISKQKGRDEKEYYLIKHAISICPDALEPRFIFCLYNSWRGNWLDCYKEACTALNIETKKKFIIDVGYEYKISFLYQKALSGIEIGKTNEAREIYINLLQNFELNEKKNDILSRYNNLPPVSHKPVYYERSKNSSYKFDNYEIIDKNYSQIYQDMFVLSMNNGKKNGTYFEIGSGNFKYGNNTYLLEKKFDWEGISIDINKNEVDNFNSSRKNKCFCLDALNIDYLDLLKKLPEEIDYLQLDCDPPHITYEILLKIPFDKYKFGVITYEHDYYNDITGSFRKKSRDYLNSKGYLLIAGNISPHKDNNPFEDWWINPDLIDENIYKLFKRDEDIPINGEKYMLTKREIQKTIITFGTDYLFKNQKKRFEKEARDINLFDSIIIENEDTIKPLIKNHSEFVKNNERGYGYWIWKPLIIKNALEKMNNNDLLVYLDCGSSIINNDLHKFENYINILKKNDIIVFEERHRFNKQFVKKNIIDDLEINDEILNNYIVEAGCIIIKKTNFSIDFIDLWFNYMTKNNYSYVNDDLGAEQHPDFQGHRHDQSLLSVLSRQYPQIYIANGHKEIYERGPFFCSRITDEGPRECAKPVPKICPKIIDCFIFNNELDLLNYRLNILDECVDYFVLVEATNTFVGKEKKLFYNENKELFEKFKDKIIHIIVDDFPHKYPNINIEKDEQWINERFQRNCIKRGIDKLTLHDNDLIVITDLDEIPNPEILKEIKENKRKIEKISCLRMDMYYYNLNCKTNICDLNCSKILTYKEQKTLNLQIEEIRMYERTRGGNTVSPHYNIIENGGWHLSFFGDKNFIINKLKSYAHQEFNNDRIINNIEEAIKSKKDLLSRENHDIQYINIEDNDNLPPKYYKYLKKFFKLPNIKDYVFFPQYDSGGNDIIYYPNKSLKELIKSSMETPECIAFNTQGFLKNKIDLLKKNNTFGKNKGIYIKKHNTIPVFGTLVCITTKWLKKQLQSIDYPIENYIIINNNANGVLNRELNEIVEKKHPFIKNLNVYHMPYNMGCAGGWNMIIKSFMFSPYWIIANDDVSFTPGFLQAMNNSAQDAEIGMVHGWGGYKNMGTFDLFLIKDWVIKSHGLFDENYYPAYFEDIDYIMRIINKPFKRVMNLNEKGFKYYHGDTIHYSISGANTRKSSPEMEIAMQSAHEKNKRYFMQKWGGDEDCDINLTENPYKTPFNKNNKLDLTTFDLDFVRSKYIDKSLFICEKVDNLKITDVIKPNVIVIDNFYKNPYDIRNYALNLEYLNPGQHGAVGFRCEKDRKIFDGTKEYFEKLLHKKIPSGNGHGEWGYSTNGCFQWCPSGTSLVYHADSQEYAGILYLTPDAPPNCGTSFFRHKKYKSICGSEVFSNDDWHDPKLEYKDWFTDSSPWEKIDSVGNVFNRLVIFKSYNIHAVTEYFGETINNSRLFQLFFFSIE